MWNEAELERGDPLNAGLVSLLVIKKDLAPELIGTAFIVVANGNRATAITAAHVFDEARKHVEPNSIHHVSALPEFLPPPKEVELAQMKALYLFGGKVSVCAIEVAIWDSASDFAALTLIAPDHEPHLFQDKFLLSDDVPQVGDQVGMIGFGEMKVIPNEDDPRTASLQRRLVVRLGRVEEIHPDGFFMLKAPCIQTSVAIFSGMSGGIVARWTGPDTPIKPFALISHAPDPQPCYDRSVSGQSVASIFRMKVTPTGPEAQIVEFQVNNIMVGRTTTMREAAAGVGHHGRGEPGGSDA